MFSITGEAASCSLNSHGAGCPNSANAAPFAVSATPATANPNNRWPVDIFMPLALPVQIPNQHLAAVDTALQARYVPVVFKEVYLTRLKMQASLMLLCGNDGHAQTTKAIASLMTASSVSSILFRKGSRRRSAGASFRPRDHRLDSCVSVLRHRCLSTHERIRFCDIKLVAWIRYRSTTANCEVRFELSANHMRRGV